MGGIALGIYAFKDQFSAFVPLMRVLPNVRKANTIAHFYLDFIEEYGCKFLPIVFVNSLFSLWLPLQVFASQRSQIRDLRLVSKMAWCISKKPCGKYDMYIPVCQQQLMIYQLRKCT